MLQNEMQLKFYGRFNFNIRMLNTDSRGKRYFKNTGFRTEMLRSVKICRFRNQLRVEYKRKELNVFLVIERIMERTKLEVSFGTNGADMY